MKSTISKNERFIILDDIENFNANSLNALLKIVEEPPENTFFIFINNQSQPLIETIYSRSLEIKIILTNDMRTRVIESLVKKNNLSDIIDYESSNLTPGNFLIFNEISKKYKIEINDNYLKNLKILITQFKKNKDINLINMLLYSTDFYFYKLLDKKENNLEAIINKKNFITNNISKFITYNLNPNSLINAINSKLSNG
jgi:DNA polymerase-3 subunit delta'